MGRMRHEDAGLAALNFDGLNRSFYRARPHDFIVRRLEALVLQAGRPDDVRRMLDEGVDFGTVHVSRGDEEPDDSAGHGHDTYVAVEAEMLYQHTVETLLRLFLAHTDDPPCPWLELSRLRDFRSFKERVRSRFLGSDEPGEHHLQETWHLMVGADPDSIDGGITKSRRVVHRLESAMRFFAGDFLEGSHRYNAAKHGLAIWAEPHGLQVGSPLIAADGPALQYLQATGDPRRWYRTTAWVEADPLKVAVYNHPMPDDMRKALDEMAAGIAEEE